MRYGAIYPVKTCICGKEFECHSIKKVACSKRCYAKLMYDRDEEICGGCGDTKSVSNKFPGFCGKICLDWRDAHPDGELRPCTVNCAWCGDLFAPRGSKNNKYCSNRCSAKAARARRQYRLRAAYIEDVDRFVRGEMDAWTCGICSGPIDRDLRHPDQMSWSLDHVIPVSRGGVHSYENTQSSHLGCNIRKNAKVLAA